MARVETLTAYECNFSLLKRNNPLKNELNSKIKDGELPRYSFADFIDKYQDYAKNFVVGENTDRAISLSEQKITFSEKNNVKIWHIVASAGKQGKNLTIVKGTGKKYDFSSDSAALYEHHVYFYENDESLYAFFHRQNGSGCKSVFYETANKVLRGIGLKLEMEVVIPMMDDIKNANPTRLTLKRTKKDISTDIAENIHGYKKKEVISELSLNLNMVENNIFVDIYRKMQIGTYDKDTAFAQIKAELDNADDYNVGEIELNIGKQKKRIKWNDLERNLGSYDITEKLKSTFNRPKEYEKKLDEIVFDYYSLIVSS